MLNRFALILLLLGVVTAGVPCEGGPCVSQATCKAGFKCYERTRGGAVGICLTQVESKYGCDICEEGVCWPLGSKHNKDTAMQQLLKEYKIELEQKDYQLRHEEKLLHSKRTSSVVKYVVIGAVTFAFVILVIFLFERFYPRRRRSTRPPPPPPEIIRIDPESSDDSSVESETENLLRDEVEDSTPDLDPEDANTCKICFDHAIDCVLLDCGHMCVCMSCAKRMKLCPMCRKPIRKRKRIYK